MRVIAVLCRPEVDSGAMARVIEGGRNAMGVPGNVILERSERSAVAGNRLVVRERIVVHDVRLKKNSFDGLARSNLTCGEPLHATAGDERLFVLHVQSRQHEKIGIGPVKHGTIVTIFVSLSMFETGRNREI